MSFSQSIIDEVWNKAIIVSNNDPNVWRKDYAGAWIRKDMYGKETEYGWEIDHQHPVSRGGTDDLVNLKPLHWRNNHRKSDDYPSFYTEVSSQGVHNVIRIQSWIIR